METPSIKKRRDRGFTLFELTVVVAIIAIMSVLATPNIMRWLVHSRFRSAVTDISINLKLAKSAAIKNNADCEVSFIPEVGRYRVACLGRTVSLDKYNAGARFASEPPEKITFTSRGLPKSNVGSEIYVTNESGESNYKVQVSPSGAIFTDKL